MRKNFLKKSLAGLWMGIGCITPGVSGGVIAVAMGLYRDMIGAISHIFKTPRKSIRFLLPIGIGLVIGVLITSQLLEWLLLRWPNQVLLFFMGLVAGGVPAVVHEANQSGGFQPRYLWALAAGIALLVGFGLLFNGNTPPGATLAIQPVTAMLCGGIVALGFIIPGISTSFILLYLGLYDSLLASRWSSTVFRHTPTTACSALPAPRWGWSFRPWIADGCWRWTRSSCSSARRFPTAARACFPSRQSKRARPKTTIPPCRRRDNPRE